MSTEERMTVETVDICPCGSVMHQVNENDYDSGGSDSGICCPNCGNEDFTTVKQLQARIAELEYVVDKFRHWYSNNGCPWSEHGFCPYEDDIQKNHAEEMAELPEDERVLFDHEDCGLAGEEGWCYAEYYLEKFREKHISQLGKKVGENEEA